MSKSTTGMAGEKRKSSYNTIAKPTFKEKFDALGNLPRFFKLVWQTNHWYTILNAILRLIRSAIPVSILYVGKLIIDEVILLSKGSFNRSHLFMATCCCRICARYYIRCFIKGNNFSGQFTRRSLQQLYIR